MNAIDFLTPDDVLIVAFVQIHRSGGDPGLRNACWLESAVAEAQATGK